MHLAGNRGGIGIVTRARIFRLTHPPPLEDVAMNQTTPNGSANPEHEPSVSWDNTTAQMSGSSPRPWVTMPPQWSQWLTKRIEFALPVWVCATVVLVLALLIFD